MRSCLLEHSYDTGRGFGIGRKEHGPSLEIVSCWRNHELSSRRDRRGSGKKHSCEEASVIYVLRKEENFPAISSFRTWSVLKAMRWSDSWGALGVQPVLTGDHENAAKTIASTLEIHEVHANCLPEDKLRWIDAYQKQKSRCMIGDGVNDAPALKKRTSGLRWAGRQRYCGGCGGYCACG